MPQRTIRFTEKITVEIESAARSRGFTSSTAFIRYAIEQELAVRKEDLLGTEDRLAASVEQVRRELSSLSRGQQALFAYVDSFVKALLTCVPEPPVDARPQAVARARERHDRLLKTAGRSMVGESSTVMQEIAGRAAE